MTYLEAPNELSVEQFNSENISEYNSIFLAGSITGAWNWQKVVAEALLPKYNVFNPRREQYDTLISGMEKEQITWEWTYLNFCHNILFWFSHETLAPITLFELGTVMEDARQNHKRIIIGIHPEYKRKNDILIQTELRAPQILKTLSLSIEDLIKRTMDQPSII